MLRTITEKFELPLLKTHSASRRQRLRGAARLSEPRFVSVSSGMVIAAAPAVDGRNPQLTLGPLDFALARVDWVEVRH
jgi:hypothetical protein